jgi:hypothetical protein
VSAKDDFDASTSVPRERWLQLGTRSAAFLMLCCQRIQISASGTRTVTENPGDAIIVLLVWVASVYCTWYFWVRTVPKASNQRLERP